MPGSGWSCCCPVQLHRTRGSVKLVQLVWCGFERVVTHFCVFSLLRVSLWCIWLQLGVLFPGKIPKLYTEVEVSSQRDPYPSENPGAGPDSPGRSSLQVAARNPTTMKPPKSSRAGEWSQQGDEENLDWGCLFHWINVVTDAANCGIVNTMGAV